MFFSEDQTMASEIPKTAAGATRRAILFAAASTAFVPRAFAAPSEIGTVRELAGQVHAERAERQRLLTVPGPLFDGDMVSTGPRSRVAMLLGLTTTVRLGPQARLLLDRYLAEAGGDLELSDGAMLFDRPETAPKVPVKLRSAYGLIGVRGTRFFAGPSRGAFGVFVARGRVEVVAAGQRRQVGAGEGTEIRVPGEPPGPVTRWSRARIDEALASVS